MTLTHEDKQNPLWRKLVKHFDERLETLRQQNDAIRPEPDTALLRGRIAEIKNILDLDKDKPII